MYKYEGAQELAELLAGEIAAFLQFYAIRLPRSSILVPIPLHRSRLAERGFNQAELLAEGIGKRLGIQVAHPLRRAKRTEQQVEMSSPKERRSNVAGAFAIRDVDAVRGRTIILVDDVSTSGATMTEAARVIRENEARSVWGIAVAKG
jgi:ComF family protein